MKEINGIKDIAKELGVSPATVSLALNDSELVNENTKKRIKKLAKNVGYVPNSAAKKLVSRKSGSIGLIVPDIENTFYASLVKHINEAVKEKGYTLLVSISNNSAKDEKRIISNMIANRVEGAVIIPANIPNSDSEYIQQLENYSIPYVFCSDYYADRKENIPVVMSDLENGMYNITKTVIEHGYNNIAYISGSPRVESLNKRLLGFEKAVAEKNIKAQVFELESLEYDAAYRTAGQILKERPDVEAFVCVNDMIALAVVNTLLEAGLKVPHDKGVTGFDNAIFSRLAFPGISTVEQDIQKIAFESINSLLDKNTEDIFIPTKLILRKSIVNKSTED